jgi:hypothetical protein
VLLLVLQVAPGAPVGQHRCFVVFKYLPLTWTRYWIASWMRGPVPAHTICTGVSPQPRARTACVSNMIPCQDSATTSRTCGSAAVGGKWVSQGRRTVLPSPGCTCNWDRMSQPHTAHTLEIVAGCLRAPLDCTCVEQLLMAGCHSCQHAIPAHSKLLTQRTPARWLQHVEDTTTTCRGTLRVRSVHTAAVRRRHARSPPAQGPETCIRLTP